MTITLELPPDAEAGLAAQAKARGLSLDDLLRTIIATAAMESVESAPTLPSQGEELDRVIDQLFDTVPIPPGVGQGAMRRENWYR